MPHGKVLRELYARKVQKEGDCCHLRVGARAETLLVALCPAARASAFERLQAAGKIARAIIDCEPQSLLAVAAGLRPGDGGCRSQRGSRRRPGRRRFASPPSRASPSLARRLRASISRSGTSLAELESRSPPPRATISPAGSRRCRRTRSTPRATGGCSRNSRGTCASRYQFYGEAQLRRLGAGAFLAVSQGNATRDAGIVRLTYRPRGAGAPAVSLVGKGICFDTGGTNLKPHKSMLDMHTDMEGSAVAVGSLYALHALRSPLGGGLLAGDHRESDRSARLQAAGRRARPQRHHHSGDSHRRRGPHGARRHA